MSEADRAVHVNVPRLVAFTSEATAAVAAVAVPSPSCAVASPITEATEAAVCPAAAPSLDAEKLVVYRVALELQVQCATLVPVHHRVLQDQLERASVSIITNLAEGAGRRSRKDKRRMYAISRGSAMETAALIDILRARHLASESTCGAARSLALRVVQLLSKLDAALA